MTAALILLAAVAAAGRAEEPPAPTPTPAVKILLARPEGAPPPRGGSLAEVAKRIKLKLPANQPRVLTNESVKQLADGVELTTAAPSGGGAPAARFPGAGSGDEAKKARWQQRYRSAIQRVRTLDNDVKELGVRAAELEREFYSHDDPAYRDSVIKPNWDNTLADLQKAKQELEIARKQPEEVLNAARRDGALPGWFRGLDSETGPPASAPAAAAKPQVPGAPATGVQPTATPTPVPPRPVSPS